jgi:hypothetical protein
MVYPATVRKQTFVTNIFHTGEQQILVQNCVAQTLLVLWRINQLLRNHREISNYTTAVTK